MGSCREEEEDKKEEEKEEREVEGEGCSRESERREAVRGGKKSYW